MTDLNFEQKQDIGLKYVLDLLEPVCPYGAKLLRKPHLYGPSERAELDTELNNVSIVCQALEDEPDKVAAIRHALSALKDVSSSINRCTAGVLSEIELFEARAFMLRVKELIPLAESLTGYVDMAGARLDPVDEPLLVLDPGSSGRLSFYIEDSRTPELLRLRKEKRGLEDRLRLLDADRLDADRLDADRLDADKESIVAERLLVASREEQELQSIYAAMSDALRPMLPILERNVGAIGRLDAAISKALLARRYTSSKPVMGGDTLFLEGAVNPEIAEALALEDRGFTPITIELPRGVTILTGANMGGKSVSIKTITLNTILAHMGFYVFCKNARIPMFDNIELINRDFSSVATGLSSFGGEILRFNEAVERLGEGGLSFIAMDEFARGTNSAEGAAISRGVVKYLNGKNCVAIFATHYDSAAEYSARRYQARGLFSQGEDGWLSKTSGMGVAFIAEHMDYGLTQVERDAESPREAVNICKLLGMDDEILNNIETED